MDTVDVVVSDVRKTIMVVEGGVLSSLVEIALVVLVGISVEAVERLALPAHLYALSVIGPNDVIREGSFETTSTNNDADKDDNDVMSLGKIGDDAESLTFRASKMAASLCR